MKSKELKKLEKKMAQKQKKHLLNVMHQILIVPLLY